MDSLVHLIYTSTAIGEPGEHGLAEILSVARRNNERRGVTGMLLFTDHTFFQVLEGPLAAVDETIRIIATDRRHSNVITIIRERIARRSFPSWSMGYVTASPREVAAATGMNDFFGQGSCFDQLDAGRAKKLLTAFRNGRWHARDSAPRENAARASRPSLRRQA